MTKKEKKEKDFVEDEVRYEGFIEQYEGVSLCVLADRLSELERTPGADLMEIKAIKDTMSVMDCDMNPYLD